MTHSHTCPLTSTACHDARGTRRVMVVDSEDVKALMVLLDAFIELRAGGLRERATRESHVRRIVDFLVEILTTYAMGDKSPSIGDVSLH